MTNNASEGVELPELLAMAELMRGKETTFDTPVADFDGYFATDVHVLLDAIRAYGNARERAAREGDSARLEQALTDPENQPSQWGTVPMAMLAAVEKDAARYRWLREWLAVSRLGAQPVRIVVRDRIATSVSDRGDHRLIDAAIDAALQSQPAGLGVGGGEK